MSTAKRDCGNAWPTRWVDDECSAACEGCLRRIGTWPRWGRGSCLVADELEDCRCGLRQRCGRGAGCRGARELAEEGGVAKERPCWALNF